MIPLLAIVILIVLFMVHRRHLYTNATEEFAYVETDSVDRNFLALGVPFQPSESFSSLTDAKVIAGGLADMVDLSIGVNHVGYLAEEVLKVKHPWVSLFNDSDVLVDVVLRCGVVVRPVILDSGRMLCVPYGWSVDNVTPKTLYLSEYRTCVSYLSPI